MPYSRAKDRPALPGGWYSERIALVQALPVNGVLDLFDKSDHPWWNALRAEAGKAQYFALRPAVSIIKRFDCPRMPPPSDCPEMLSKAVIATWQIRDAREAGLLPSREASSRLRPVKHQGLTLTGMIWQWTFPPWRTGKRKEEDVDCRRWEWFEDLDARASEIRADIKRRREIARIVRTDWTWQEYRPFIQQCRTIADGYAFDLEKELRPTRAQARDRLIAFANKLADAREFYGSYLKHEIQLIVQEAAGVPQSDPPWCDIEDPRLPSSGFSRLGLALQLLNDVEIWSREAAQKENTLVGESTPSAARTAVRSLARVWHKETGNRPGRKSERVTVNEHTVGQREAGAFLDFCRLTLGPTAEALGVNSPSFTGHVRVILKEGPQAD